ncbi:hypothetical protein ACWCPT_01210 [Streptomyces sp. NPDC002308]
MADDRDEWLDRDAAEKLLRGEPVVPPGGQARSAARSLSEVLGAARPGSSADGELPGEEAALSAFRQVGPVRGAPGTGRHRRPVGPVPEAGTTPGGGTLDPVRLGTPPSPSRRRERPRFGRPVRIGLAASLAGCALGGVAVAAGTGALAGAFGGTEHGPASTVSVAASPDSTPEASGTGTPSGAPTGTGTPSGGTVPGEGGSAAPGVGGTDGGNGTGKEGSSGSHAGGYGDGYGSPDRGTYGGPDGSGGSGGFGSGWYAEAVDDCHDYRGGDLDERERRRLAELARGEKNIPEYCAGITAAYPGGSVAGDGPDGATPDGTGYGSGHAGDGKGEWDQDGYQQGQSSAYSPQDAPAGGPAATTLAAPSATPAAPAPKTAATRAGVRTSTKAGAEAAPERTLSTGTTSGGAWATDPGANRANGTSSATAANGSNGVDHGPGPEAAERAGRTGWDAQTCQGGYGDGQGAGCGSDGYAEPGSGSPDRAAYGWI